MYICMYLYIYIYIAIEDQTLGGLTGSPRKWKNVWLYGNIHVTSAHPNIALWDSSGIYGCNLELGLYFVVNNKFHSIICLHTWMDPCCHIYIYICKYVEGTHQKKENRSYCPHLPPGNSFIVDYPGYKMPCLLLRISIYIYIYICIYICVCVCIYIYIFVCVYYISSYIILLDIMRVSWDITIENDGIVQ